MIGLFTALLVAAAAPEASGDAPAAAPPPASAPAAAPTKSKSERICWDETPTGTRFSHRVCATRQELEQRRRDDQDWKMQLRPVPAGAG